jgi:hypothetical protein
MNIFAILATTAAIFIDVNSSPIKDQRDSTCAPDLGYAGCLTEVSLYNDAFSPWAYGSGAKQTEKALRDCGARFMRQWDAVKTWQLGMSGAGNVANPKLYWSLWKKMGVKILFTLEHYGAWPDKACAKKRTGDLETVKRVICDYIRWIKKGRYEDVVAGFELGNEPYFGNDPESYAERWCAIVPEIKKLWPDVKIGIPIAEYRAGDPDLDVVRKRLGEKKMMPGGGEFEINRFNQWSGRFVVAMSNQMHNISHVIYHFYGGDAPYGCSQSGFGRIKNFAKIYPQLADKRVWITEWRERSDEDVRCHQMFASTLFKGHYMLSVLAQPNIDGINLHCLGCFAGGLNISMNASFAGEFWRSGFMFQSDPLQGYNFYPDPDVAVGERRYTLGPAAPLFKIYTDALVDHPVILEHGTLGKQGAEASYWSSALFYGSSGKQRAVLNRGGKWKDVPPIRGNVEWIAALNPRKTSLVFLMCNTTTKRQEIPVNIVNATFAGSGVLKSVSCEPELIYHHNIPGEEPLWYTQERKITSDFIGSNGVLTIEPDTIQSVVLPIRKAASPTVY